jgi:trehalose 6-phosphate phosphatase
MHFPAALGADAAPALPPLLRGPELLALCGRVVHLRPLLIVSDFDGTLAPIVMDPWGASILPGARRALRRLAGTRGILVALLSGRTAADLAARARVGGALYLGNHGVERAVLERHARAEMLRVRGDSSLEAYVGDAQRLAAEVAAAVPQAWLVVEPKGPAVAFHFRAAPDVADARRRVIEAVERADPASRFVRLFGRRVVELRPPGATLKRDALRELVEELRPAVTVMLGDDAADAEAFVVLQELREAGLTRGLAVAVHAHAEMPEPVAAAADVALASPGETARFLAGLARATSTAHGRTRHGLPTSSGTLRAGWPGSAGS